MTGAEVDAIKEADDSRIWEELNEPDTRKETSVEYLEQALETLNELDNNLQEASCALGDLPDSIRIGAIRLDVDDVVNAVRKMIERLK